MLKMLAYDLKKNLRPLTILSFISMTFFITIFLSSDLFYIDQQGQRIPSMSLVGIHNGVFIVLSILMPFFVLKFKMKKITIDQMYSLPIKREKLYLEKYLFGLIAIFIPYTLAMIGSHIVVLCHPYCYELFPNFYYVIPAYFTIGLILIICYTISCFFYTRCNTALDGILISIGSVLFMSFLSFSLMISFPDGYALNVVLEISYLNIFYVANFIGTVFNELITNTGLEYITANARFFGHLAIYVAIAAIAMYGYLRLNKSDKAEEATGLSRSSFAYKLWIPLYAIAGGLVVPCNMFLIVFVVLIGICIYIGILIYLRSVKKLDVIYLIAYGAFVVGILLNLLI